MSEGRAKRILMSEYSVLMVIGVAVVFAVSDGAWLSIPVGVVCVGLALLLLALLRRRRDAGVRGTARGN